MHHGGFVGTFGSHGNGTSQFDGPHGIGYERRSGDLGVADTGNNRIVIVWGYRAWGGYGENWVGSPPTEGRPTDRSRVGIYALDGPRAVDWGGTRPGYRMAVADAGNDRVQFSSTTGLFPTNFGSAGLDDKEFWSPSGVSFTYGYLAVADTGNHRVQVFYPNRDLAFVIGQGASEPQPYEHAATAARALACTVDGYGYSNADAGAAP